MTSGKLSVLNRLQLFAKRAQELSALRLVTQGGLDAQIEYKGTHFEYSGPEPDEEDLRSFLLLFRQFISEKEPIFIRRVFNDRLRFLKEEQLNEQIGKAKDAWADALESIQGLGIRVWHGRAMTPEDVLDLWINGYYFHNDPDYAAQIEQMSQHRLPIARMALLLTLTALTPIILFMGEAVNKVAPHNSVVSMIVANPTHNRTTSSP